ncbi:DUF4268 domain-containing protein [uncultured Dubosiella sp.]|uniref:DUF4268 domain-containing protein n=1 Tax=uncultured Dubosiella sp. TaxID=1937011 RepID=UPI0025B47C10|nr:DUF4268 domain-containing protein [uncultured Dubosiella sp.]
MKGEKNALLRFMDGHDKYFVIPVYQRNYNWTIKNCERLFDDLVKVSQENLNSHFFGCIVFQNVPSGRDIRNSLIDGQQRITTVSLLLLAMCKAIEDGVVPCEDSRLKDQIYEEYLINKWAGLDQRIRLIPAKNDRETYRQLLQNEELTKQSNMTKNYQYFYERLKKGEITLADLFTAMKKLDIIGIALEGDDDAQLIFESLNSTGLDLSEGDKIRNYILMNLREEKQEEYYDCFWSVIEENANGNVDDFIRDYLSMKTHVIPSYRKVYEVFKKYAIQNGIQSKELLEDLKRYSKFYSILTGKRSFFEAVDAIIMRLNVLETSVIRPYMLEVLDLHGKNNLSDEEVHSVFEWIESFIARRMWCNVPTNALNKLFVGLNREIMALDGTTDEYVEKLKYCLLGKEENSRFPTDAELQNAIRYRDVYRMNRKNKEYILERFENEDTKEDKDVYRHLEDHSYSIEHIMPQNLSKRWQADLGANYKQIHEEWLHRLANLTLTAYNSKYSNASFDEKKAMNNGYLDSGIRMTQEIARNEKWGLAELEARSLKMAQKALEIWKWPITMYVPSEKRKNIVSLADFHSMTFTGKKIKAYIFQGNEVSVLSWIEMFECILRDLYFINSGLLREVAEDKDNKYRMRSSLSTNQKDLPVPKEVGQGLYYNQNTSTETKCKILSKLFGIFGIEEKDLEFVMHKEKEMESKRYDDLYGTFWQFAFPKMKEKMPMFSCAFEKITALNHHFVDVFFGVKGVHIALILNRREVRVVAYIDQSEKRENKKRFDEIFAHKQELEAKAGQTMFWDRGEGKRSCQIGFQTDLSVVKKEDWEKIVDYIVEEMPWVYREIIEPYWVNGEEENVSS